jgi:hypothetical protein
MRIFCRRLVVGSLAFFVSGAVQAENLAPDFVLSLLRFGLECQRAATPRRVYLGDRARFAVSVEQPTPAASGGAPQRPARVTYRAFYRDLAEPNLSDSAVTLRCRAASQCISVYRGAAVARASTLRLDTCSPRTTILVRGAARELIRAGGP